MHFISKTLIAAAFLLFVTSAVPGETLRAAIFEGSVTEEGVRFGLCLDNPEEYQDECGNLDCDSAADADNPLCLSETVVGTGIARTSLEGSGITHTDDFGDFVIKLVNFSLPYLTLAAFVGYVVAGFLYVTALGNEDQLQKAKKILIWSSIGLIVVILSYAITNLFTGQLVEGLAG